MFAKMFKQVLKRLRINELLFIAIWQQSGLCKGSYVTKWIFHLWILEIWIIWDEKEKEKE